MSEHDDVRSLLDAYRGSLQPTAGDQTRVRRAIAAREERRAWWWGLVWRCSALAAATAVVLVLALSWLRSRGLLGDGGPKPPPSEAQDSARPRDPERAHEGRAPSVGTSENVTAPAQLEIESTVDPVAAPPVEPAAPRSRVVPRSDGAVANEATDAGAAEAVLVDSARRALDDDDLATVLRLAAEHTRRFPGGTLAVEVAALRALALCGDGRLKQGRGEALVFLREHPRAPYRDRIRHACGLVDEGEGAQ